MPCIGIKCDKIGKSVSFDECLACDKCSMSRKFRHKLISFTRKKDGEKPRISVTRIIDCLRKSYYSMTQDYYMDRQGLVATGLGTMIHSKMEDEFEIAEQFVTYTTEDGVVVVGYVDGRDPSTETIYDIKTTKYTSYKRDLGANVGDRDQLQVSAYNTMLAVEGNASKHARIIYVGLADHECYEREVQLRDMKQYIRERAKILDDAIKNGVQPPADPQWDKYECKYCDNTKCEKNQK